MFKKIASQLFGPKDFSVGLVQEILVTLGKFGFSPDMAKEVSNVKSGMAKKIVSLFAKGIGEFGEMTNEWQKFYQECLGMSVDFSALRIPECPGSGWRLLIIAQGVLPEQVFLAMKNFFRVWKYSDKSLDDLVVWNERDSKNGAYAIWVRDVQEADEIHKNKSANQVKAEKLSTETLTEREVHELKFFRETGKHLDVSNVTLCSGSRCDGGLVPHVRWYRYYDGLRVSWYGPDSAHVLLRSREAVS